ncbi:MAG TPA: rhodanese-like domain-containing protein [Longimicrobiales bacterium]
MTAPRLLVAAAVVLSFGALLVGSPVPGGEGHLDVARLALMVETGGDAMTPRELARQLRDRSTDVAVVDLRSQEAFDDFHLPRARRIPLEKLSGASFPDGTTVVVYAAGDEAAERAWRALQGMGYDRARVLRGGVGGWLQSVMAPVLPEDATPSEREAWPEIAELSRYFGGNPTRGSVTGLPFGAGDSPDSAVAAAIKDARRKGCGW